jgi:hypothetical protein
MLHPSLDQLVLEFSGFIPLGLQLALVLENQHILFSCNPEWRRFSKKKPVGSDKGKNKPTDVAYP